MRTTRRPAIALALVALVGLAACGSDDKASTTTTKAAAVTTVPATTASAPAAAGFCDASLAIETAPDPQVDDSASQEAQQAAFVDYAEHTILPLGKALQAVAPADLQADVTTALAGVQKTIDTGDPSSFNDPGFAAATKKIHDESVTTCGWTPVAVTATEYKFEGVPTTMKTGITTFELANKGSESHEMILVRKNDGVTDDAKTLLSMPQDQAMSKVTMIGNAEADPASTDSLVADLQPGTYVYACFIPVGAKPGAAPAENAQPHFMMGMLGEFTVG